MTVFEYARKRWAAQGAVAALAIDAASRHVQ